MEDEKKYEISFILRSEEAVTPALGFLEKIGAKVIEKSLPVKIKLSYPIKRETAACFMYAIFSLAPEKVLGLDKELKLSNDVLRFLIITPPVQKDERRERPRRAEGPKQPEPVKKVEFVAPVREPEILSNELLEKRLEEILK